MLGIIVLLEGPGSDLGFFPLLSRLELSCHRGVAQHPLAPVRYADRVHASSCKNYNQGEGWPHQVLTPRGGDGRYKHGKKQFSVFLSIFRHQYLETEKRNQVH